jgi:two-component system, sporulation sensor kinase C
VSVHSSDVNNAEKAAREIIEALGSLEIGVAIADSAGNILEVNESFGRIVGRSLAEIRKSKIHLILKSDDHPSNRKQLEMLVEGAIHSFASEDQYRKSNGKAWVRKTLSLIPGAGRDQAKFIALVEDITPQKRAEDVLREQEKLATLGRLTSMIIHEINNPLESVMNLLYLARQSKTLQAADQYLEQAETELRRAAQITTQALRFQREKPNRIGADLGELLDSVLALFATRLKRAGIRIEIEKRDSPAVVCLPGEIKQVFTNLIGNAIDAMPQGGELRLRLRPGTDWASGKRGARVTIADTGTGMSAQTLEHVYEAFFTTKGSSGTGLGLWITAGIVKKHQGSIYVRSRNTGRSGTVFSFVLPELGSEGM